MKGSRDIDQPDAGSYLRAAAEDGLYRAIMALKSEAECRSFFNDLCTPAELESIVDRWAVVPYIEQGLPYRKIHELTGVSVTTIGRVARFLTTGSGGYRLALKRLSATEHPPSG